MLSAATAPIPLLIDTLWALVVFHFRSTCPPPSGKVVGDNVNASQVAAFSGGSTVTLAVQVSELLVPTAVRVKVVF